MVVPIKLAIATWRIEETCPSCSPPTRSTRAPFARRSPVRGLRLSYPHCVRNITHHMLPAATLKTLLILQRSFDEVEPVVAPEHLAFDEEGGGAEDTPLHRLRGRVLETLLRLGPHSPFEHLFRVCPHTPGDGCERTIFI